MVDIFHLMIFSSFHSYLVRAAAAQCAPKRFVHPRRRFSPILSPIFSATFVQVSILSQAESGRQVRSSDHTLQKLCNRAKATVFERML